jgi:formyltetrahydrofolate synthetase
MQLMAILALTSDLKDMRQRIGRMVVAFSKDGTISSVFCGYYFVLKL